LDLPATDSKTRIVSTLGKMKHADLLLLNEDTDVLKVTGFVGKHELAKKIRGEQYMYVNHRFIKSAYLHHAIRSAFENLIPVDSQPTYVVILQIDPARIDVNVSPSKTEIKFEDEKILYSIVHASVKRAIGSFMLVPELDIKPVNPNLNIGSPHYNPEPKVNPRYNPFQSEQHPVQKKPYGWEKIYQPLQNVFEPKSTPAPDLFKQLSTTSLIDAVFQYEDTLVVKAHGELYIINIMLARERIWYERYLSNIDNHQYATQQLLFPKTLEFSSADAEILASVIDEVKSIGFDIGEFGKNTFIINGLPADLPKGNEQQIIEGLLENLKENRAKHKLTEKENVARSMAKNAAMFANKILNPNEQSLLASELFACDFPRYCPFGRPVYVNMPREELNKLFKI
ncbi:MAG: hypothetical protein J5I91_03605, partial [Bacteroidetes bacterium]|nr:hypothetical protein [Bacteroidota bacterium]